MFDFLNIATVPLLHGIGVTLSVALISLALGLLLAFLFALLEQSRIRPIAWLVTLFVMILRGLPEILVVLGFYFLIPSLLNLIADGIELPDWLGGTLQWDIPDALFDLNPIYFGVIALSLLYGAYASQTLRGALKSISSGQKEAADTLGLSPRHTFFKITLPQLWQHALPGLSNQWLALLKDTALVSLIGVTDLLKVLTNFITNPIYTPNALLFYLFAALIYLVISLLSQVVIRRIERHAFRYSQPMI